MELRSNSTSHFGLLSIPQQVWLFAKLSDFNGKKYLQSDNPIWPSFYGSDNKTMIVVPDAVLRQLIQASTGPKSGGLIDRVHEVIGGNDLFLALDMAALHSALQMGLPVRTSQSHQKRSQSSIRSLPLN